MARIAAGLFQGSACPDNCRSCTFAKDATDSNARRKDCGKEGSGEKQRWVGMLGTL